ncbi:TRAP transporter small permease [Aquibaculum sediminis]|uniref:TRAP transporter small permease n=1 Tax=Aquibaculum sediminis TaxID=3231907 RepID=UPI00345305AF
MQGNRDDRPAPLAHWAEKLACGLERLLDWVLIAMLFVMTVSVVWQVFARYVLSAAPSWSEEVARYLMVWVTFLGAAAVLRSGGHITVTVLADTLPPRLRGPLLLLRDLVILFAAGVLALFGWRYAGAMSFQDSAALELPMSLPYAALWIGGGLVLLMVVLTRLAHGGEWQPLDEEED